MFLYSLLWQIRLPVSHYLFPFLFHLSANEKAITYGHKYAFQRPLVSGFQSSVAGYWSPYLLPWKGSFVKDISLQLCAPNNMRYMHIFILSYMRFSKPYRRCPIERYEESSAQENSDSAVDFTLLNILFYATARNVELPSAFQTNLPRWRQIEAAGVQQRTYKGLFVHSWKGLAERQNLFWLCRG